MKNLTYIFYSIVILFTISCIPTGTTPVDLTIRTFGLISDSSDYASVSTIDTNVQINLPINGRLLTLPESYDLPMPTPGDQGSSNTCVAWAVAYATMSYNLRYSSRENYFSNGSVNKSRVFSPSYLFNKLVNINDANVNGTTIHKALRFAKSNGVEILENFPYTTNIYSLPNTSNDLNASNYKINDYEAYSFSINRFKELVSNGYPVIIGIDVDTNFMKGIKNVGNEFIYRSYDPSARRGGHCVTICGYDNSKNAFKIINSWHNATKPWGNNGIAWIDYGILGSILESHPIFPRRGYIIRNTSFNSTLMAFFPFNNGIVDESILGNNATNFGATLTTDRFSRANSAYLFNGSNYIRIPTNSSLNLNNYYTVSLWYNQTGSSCTGTNCYSGILSKYQPANSNTCFELELREEGSCTSTSSNINFLHFTPPTQVPTNLDMITYSCSNFNAWHHLVVTKENSITKLYLDGSLKSTVTNSNYTNSNNDGYIEIGRQYYKDLSNSFHNFKGKIDDIRIYQRVLSASEVQQLYN